MCFLRTGSPLGDLDSLLFTKFIINTFTPSTIYILLFHFSSYPIFSLSPLSFFSSPPLLSLLPLPVLLSWNLGSPDPLDSPSFPRAGYFQDLPPLLTPWSLEDSPTLGLSFMTVHFWRVALPLQFSVELPSVKAHPCEFNIYLFLDGSQFITGLHCLDIQFGPDSIMEPLVSPHCALMCSTFITTLAVWHMYAVPVPLMLKPASSLRTPGSLRRALKNRTVFMALPLGPSNSQCPTISGRNELIGAFPSEMNFQKVSFI